MKQFVETKKVTYNLMSFTAFKALLIFSMLLESPKSYDEINNTIKNNTYLKENISIDTMRVYINSLKRIGCEVKRIKNDDKISRYYISSHPFELKITEDEVQSIIKIYKSISKSLNINDLLSIDNLFEKISNYIKDTEIYQKIRGNSILKDIDKDLLKQLITCCENKNLITIKYKSPNSGEKDIEIAAEKVEISNNKIYLFGYGYEYKQTTGFLVNRIKCINAINTNPDNSKFSNILKVIYEVRTQNEFTTKDYETIISHNNNLYKIEANTNNSFYLKQRLLELGYDCKIISPEEFKQEFIETLTKMKAVYCND